MIKDRSPPVAPYCTPILGSGLSFFWNTKVVGKLSKKQQNSVLCLQLFKTKINFVTGSRNIINVWRSKDLDGQAVTLFSLKQFFDTPIQSTIIYLGDNSGISPQPHPCSNVPTKDRYYYQNRKHIVSFFNGPGLKHMGNRFAILLTGRIHELQTGNAWIEHDDLFGFIQRLVIGPAVEAMCGPALFDQNPDFGEAFWKLDSDILYFFKAYPWWLVPRAYRNRRKLLESVKNWHAFASTHFDESSVESDGHDRFYGSPLMRSRHAYLPKIQHLGDADALASQDLGLLWAENANSIPAIFWMIYEALRQPGLVQKALDEVVASQAWCSIPSDPCVDIETLCSVPILQSLYAETLRLYTSLFSLRSAIYGDFKLDSFTIPKGELIAVDSRVSAMDNSIWNTGKTATTEGETHPLDQFWAERFLMYPNRPGTGPLRADLSSPREVQTKAITHSDGDDCRFTTEGLAGAWTPYGGGSRQCPGRNFAKQEIIVGFALILSMLDIELICTKNMGHVKPDIRYYGLGTLPPKGKIPFRMRRRT
ncbi:MAG: hypothetical protein Q9225_001934 [Loekoesia sp. 1 TL-2023]